MSYKRRDFLKIAAAISTGLALGPLSHVLAGCNAPKSLNGKRNFGLQLYTLRDVLPKDPVGVLKEVAQFDYKQIESYEGPQGIFWGLGNTGFKKCMDDLGMTIVSSHCDINKNFEQTAAEAAAIGMNYLICPYLGPQKTLDDFKRFADIFNQRGEVCRKNGLRFAYHNHDYSFKPVEGQLPQDILLQYTDKELVDFEMDIYWVVTAGEDPKRWLQNYPGRFRLGHVKDRKKATPLTEKDASVVIGTGSINFPDILQKAAESGMNYFMVEQEVFEELSPLAAVKANAEYMKNVQFK